MAMRRLYFQATLLILLGAAVTRENKPDIVYAEWF